MFLIAGVEAQGPRKKTAFRFGKWQTRGAQFGEISADQTLSLFPVEQISDYDS